VHKKILTLGLSGAALLAACAVPPPAQTAPRAKAPARSAPEPMLPSLTLDAYKKGFAEQVARASPEMFSEPIPEMLKSVVVLDITIDRDGKLLRVAVRRSNGYKALENRAMESVRRAAPYQAPAWSVRRADGTVNFLETFLFRDDGRFRIRSLVAAR